MTIFGALALLIIGIAALVCSSVMRDYMTHAVVDNAVHVQHNVDKELCRVSSAADQMAHGFAFILEDGEVDIAILEDLSKRLLVDNSLVSSCGIFLDTSVFSDHASVAAHAYRSATDGVVADDISGDWDYWSNKSYYTHFKDDKNSLWFESDYDDRNQCVKVSVYSTAIVDSKGRFLGVLAVSLDENVLDSIILGSLDGKNNYSAVLLGGDGTYMVNPDSSQVYYHNIRETLEKELGNRSSSLADSILRGCEDLFKVKHDNKAYFVCHTALETNPWTVVLRCSRKDILSQIWRLFVPLLLSIIFISVVAIVFLRMILSRIVKPVENLSQSMSKMANGEFEEEALSPVDMKNEIGDIYRSAQAMRNAILQYNADLGKARQDSAHLEDDLAQANAMQLNMLPRTGLHLLGADNCDISAKLIPAEYVGGDLYDYFIRGRFFHLLIGDVSGHGMPAAIVMSRLMSSVRSFASDIHEPSVIMESLNKMLCENNAYYMFTTLFYAVIDISTGFMSYCNAGHDAPLLISHNGSVKPIEVASNVPLGLDPKQHFEQQQTMLKADDIVLLYTDGVTEAADKDLNRYGIGRLTNLVAQSHDKSVDDILGCVEKEVQAFMGDTKQMDDITMLALRYRYNLDCSCPFDQLILHNQLSEVDRLHAFLDDYGQEYNISKEIISYIKLAVEELVVNVISYGYTDDADDHVIEINFIFDYGHRLINISVVDDGIPFNPLERPEFDITTPFEERRVGGLGVHIVREVMDNVRYRRKRDKNDPNKGYNVLVLQKRV